MVVDPKRSINPRNSIRALITRFELCLMSCQKEAGHDLLFIASKYRIIIQLGDHLREVKYNKIS